MEWNIPVCGPDGKTKVKEALIRDLLRWCEGQPEVEASPLGACAADVPVDPTIRSAQRRADSQSTPTESDERGHLRDSNGSKSRTTMSGSFGIFEGENDKPSPVSNVGTRRWNAPARGWDKLHRVEGQASSRAAFGSWTTATVAEVRLPIFRSDGVAIGDTLGT